MKKTKIIEKLIDAWKPVFKAYPTLKLLPVYAWGRYYKYESAGNPFEYVNESDGLEGFSGLDIDTTSIGHIDWLLLEDIDEEHNQQGGNLWTGKWGGFSPFREDMVKHWDFDERGGMCVVIVKKDEILTVEVVSCGSPE